MSRTSAITLILMLTVGFAAATASTDSTGCWTCAPNWYHWYDLGWSAPSNGDKCQCVQSTTTTTTASKVTTTTATPTTTRNCWTCPSGMKHWYDLGMNQPADACACVAVAATTTTATPTTTRNCWTCPNGYKHWYDLGMNQPADPCACVAVTTTVVPVATTTTTKSATTTTATPTTTRNCWTCSSGFSHWYDLGMAEPSDPCACVATTATTSKPASTAAATTRMQAFINAMTPTSTSLGSISFSPGIGSYSPSNPPPLSLVGTLMDNLISSTAYRTIMTYYIDAYTIPLAASKGLKVLGIIYIVPGQDNTALVNAAISVAKSYPDTLISISCGNEMGANYGLTDAVVSAVQQCTSMLRNAGVSQPIGVIDTYYSWCSQNEASCNVAWTAVSNNVDWIGLNDYPFWDNLYSGVTPCNSPTQAPQVTLSKHKKIASLYGKQVVITEFGWASAASGSSIKLSANYITGQQCGIANDANQKAMVQAMIDLYRSEGLPCNTFEAYREPWKGTSDIDVNRYWGICLGTAPYTCINAPK
jgi:exo-beta-1,3-glucanase (GH17 family)